jgi:hypothetical protein
VTLDVDRREAEPASSATVRHAACAALLLLAALAASVLTVELPAPAPGGKAQAPTYVPASGRWRPLGQAATPDAPGSEGTRALNAAATMEDSGGNPSIDLAH